MLLLSLPKSKLAGTCRINDQHAEYRVLKDHLEFRYEGQEAWDRRRILDAFQDDDQIRFSCDDWPGSEGPYILIRPDMAPMNDETFFWLAVNGASVAASGIPMPLTVTVRPTPEQLSGIAAENRKLQRRTFC